MAIYKPENQPHVVKAMPGLAIFKIDSAATIEVKGRSDDPAVDWQVVDTSGLADPLKFQYRTGCDDIRISGITGYVQLDLIPQSM